MNTVVVKFSCYRVGFLSPHLTYMEHEPLFVENSFPVYFSHLKQSQNDVPFNP